MQHIRLTDAQVSLIRKCFQECFLNEDHLWLFGSRVNPKSKGGDIDLYIETTYTDAKKVVEAKLRLLVMLEKELGDQKIDVVVKFKDHKLLIHKIAKEEGVKLV